MRNAFADEITKLAAQDGRIVLLSGDIGNRLFDNYKAQCPDRFFNCGVAEQDMVGVAAGMGLSGLRPVTYTITPFTTARCFEQIKLDICYHEVPAVITSVGGGLSYASLGPTHHSLEDIGTLRSLPGLTILCPGDAWEVRATLRAALKHDGPVYLRLGKKKEPLVHADVPDIQIGKALVLSEGDEVCLISTGNILPNVVATAELLRQQGVSCRVASMHTVKPMDVDLLGDAFERFKVVAIVEEHGLVGGLSGAVAEWLADHGPARARLLRFGTRDEFLHIAGNQAFARKYFGLVPDAMAARITGLLAELK
ncbi:MAG TPA: transketolase C-terminal domain-containing protein [Kiritimatiellia bacterium]|nr:transketolase C-terminal domain-containing protein [Kiritimatiellia bacterium]